MVDTSWYLLSIHFNYEVKIMKSRVDEILDCILNLPLEWDERVINYGKPVPYNKDVDRYGWFTGGYLRSKGLIGSSDQFIYLGKSRIKKYLEQKQYTCDNIKLYRLKQDMDTYVQLTKEYKNKRWILLTSSYAKKITELDTQFINGIVFLPLSINRAFNKAKKLKDDKDIFKKVLGSITPAVDEYSMIPPSYVDAYIKDKEEFQKRLKELTRDKNDWIKLLETMLSYWKVDQLTAPNEEIKVGERKINPFEVCKKMVALTEESIEFLKDDDGLKIFNMTMDLAPILRNNVELKQII